LLKATSSGRVVARPGFALWTFDERTREIGGLLSSEWTYGNPSNPSQTAQLSGITVLQQHNVYWMQSVSFLTLKDLFSILLQYTTTVYRNSASTPLMNGKFIGWPELELDNSSYKERKVCVKIQDDILHHVSKKLCIFVSVRTSSNFH